MDKYLNAREIFSDSVIEVGISWKTIYLGKKDQWRKKKK